MKKITIKFIILFVFILVACSKETSFIKAPPFEHHTNTIEEDLRIHLDYIFNNNQLLDNTYKGYTISYKSLSDNFEITNNIVKKISNNNVDNILIEATISGDNYHSSINIDGILIDEYYAYVMSYFNGDINSEVGRIAYSYDGLNWIETDIMITSNKLTKRVRDPFIIRNKEGNFTVVATVGYDSPYIYYWTTDNLKDYENHKTIQAAIKDDNLEMTGLRAWAPEIIYNVLDNLYYIYFSDPLHIAGGAINYLTTNDFNEFTYPRSLLDLEYPVIDASVFRLNDHYYMLYKNEAIEALTIHYATTDNLANGFKDIYDNKYLINKRFVEGPFVVNNNDTNYLYVDDYRKETFKVGKFNDLDNIEWLNDTMYNLPKDVRHASVIKVTKKELDNLLN